MNNIQYHDAHFDVTYTVFFSDTHILLVERRYGDHVDQLSWDGLPATIQSKLSDLILSHPSRQCSHKS